MNSQFRFCNLPKYHLSGFLFLLSLSLPAVSFASPDSKCEKPFFIPAKASHCAGRKVDDNPVRIQQAKEIIEANHKIVEDSIIYIAQAEKDIAESKRLQGEARQYTRNLHIQAPMLKGKALSDATKQYKLDLKQFSDHVKRYNLHTLEVRKNFGACQASKDAYEKMKKELSLHCDEFHMQDVEPPHICLSIDTSVVEAMGAQNKVQQQAMRLAQAQADLAKTEARLQKSITESGIIDKEVMLNSKLALQEQELASEFGRLKEEHRQLDVERRALSRSGVKVVVPSVRAKVKGH